MKLSELAKQLDMEVVRVIRDCDVDSVELCTKIRGMRTLTYLEKEKFLPSLDQGSIAGVICPESLAGRIPQRIQGILVCDAPKFAFYCLHNYLAKQQAKKRFPTSISSSATISPQAIIAPYNVIIGDYVTVDPGAVIGEDVTVHEYAHIYAGVVVGAKSFNPVRYKERSVMMEDCGSVVIGRNVEICPQSAIVRGVLQDEVTLVEDHVKIDTFVHVAHGVHIRKRAFIASGAVLGGNCSIGENAWVGINATVANRLVIGDNARVSMGAAVTKDVPAGQTVSGNFAIDHQKFLRNLKQSIEE